MTEPEQPTSSGRRHQPVLSEWELRAAHWTDHHEYGPNPDGTPTTERSYRTAGS